MLKVAMLGGWHVHAKGYANAINKMQDCRVTAVWDTDPIRGKGWAEELGCTWFPDLNTLLNEADADAVAIGTETSLHKDVIPLCIKAGKHIFTEKVLTLHEDEALEIKRLLEGTEVKFCISFPHRCDPRLLLAEEYIKSGKLGTVTYARLRNAHDGASAGWLPDSFFVPETTGGGAMMDLGAHPMYILPWLMGEPKTVASVFTKLYNKPVEDNAVSVFSFENGAIGVSETAFVSSCFPLELELCGTKGSLTAGGPTGKVMFCSKELTAGEWQEVTELPKALPQPLEQWRSAIMGEGKIYFGIDDAVQLTRVMEGAYKAYAANSTYSYR